MGTLQREALDHDTDTDMQMLDTQADTPETRAEQAQEAVAVGLRQRIAGFASKMYRTFRAMGMPEDMTPELEDQITAEFEQNPGDPGEWRFMRMADFLDGHPVYSQLSPAARSHILSTRAAGLPYLG